MARDDFADAGRDADVGPDTADGFDSDIGGSKSGGDAGDAHAVGAGQVTQTGDVCFRG